MNLSNRQKLVESIIISAIGVIFGVGSAYFPIMGLLILLLPTPYIIITARSGIRYGLMSIFISIIILLTLVNPIVSLTLGVLFFIPGAAMGYQINKEKKPFDAISWGFIVGIISAVMVINGVEVMTGNNIIKNMIDMLSQILKTQTQLLKDMKLINKEFGIKDIIEQISVVVPSFIIVQSFMVCTINYYIATIILTKTKMFKENMPRFKEFTLPGNIILGVVLIYILSYLYKYINPEYYKALTANIEIVLSSIFLVQGLAVYSFFLDEFKVNIVFKKIIIIISILIGPIATIISFLGILDSGVNFRKIKR